MWPPYRKYWYKVVVNISLGRSLKTSVWSGSKITQINRNLTQKGYNAPFWKQFWILFKRQLRITFRNPMLSHLRFVAHICVGLLFGGLCWQIGNDASKIDQNVSFIFLSMLFLLFSSLMPTLMQFPADINVMIAEYRNRWYSSGAYFLAKTLSDLPFSILFDMLFTVIGTIHTKIHRKYPKWPIRFEWSITKWLATLDHIKEKYFNKISYSGRWPCVGHSRTQDHWSLLCNIWTDKSLFHEWSTDCKWSIFLIQHNSCFNQSGGTVNGTSDWCSIAFSWSIDFHWPNLCNSSFDFCRIFYQERWYDEGRDSNH